MEQDILTVSVSQLNHYIRRVLDNNGYLKSICVKGEISNYKRHPSGHLYLTLKDETSVLRSVMFRADAASLRFDPEDGMKVIARGRVSVYEASGSYQLYIESMEADGEGALAQAYEKLKQKLESEGLFDQRYKMPLPPYPETICLVTASSGAAVQDMMNVLGRRYPLAAVKLYPVSVQGEGAASEIAAAIQFLNKHKIGDVIITGRGGGSIEDLWVFNEEVVARAIFASQIPVISAVGHETDFTIADFVADLRAPTPSAAAELAVPDITELAQRIFALRSGLFPTIRHQLLTFQKQLDTLTARPAFAGFSNNFAEKRMTVDMRYKALQHALDAKMEKTRASLQLAAGKLDALSPLSALGRGFVYAQADGKSLRSITQLKENSDFLLRFSDGIANCTANTVQSLDEISG